MVVLTSFAIKAELITRLKHDWALYPDHIVFLGPKPILLDEKIYRLHHYSTKTYIYI